MAKRSNKPWSKPRKRTTKVELSPLGEKLYAYCEREGMDLATLCKRVGTTTSAMHKWCTGRAFPRKGLRDKLGKMLGEELHHPRQAELDRLEARRQEELAHWSRRAEMLACMYPTLAEAATAMGVTRETLRKWRKRLSAPAPADRERMMGLLSEQLGLRHAE